MTAWVAAGLLTLTGAALLWLFSADLGTFKPGIVNVASRQLGRRIDIDGELHIRLGQQAVLVAEGIRVADAPWSAPGPMVEVGRVELRFDLRSLFAPPLVVNLVDIDDVRVRLSEDETETGNWEFEGLQGGDEPEPAADAHPFNVLVQEIAVDNARLNLSTPGRPDRLRVEVQNLHQQLLDNGFLSVSLSGRANDRNLALDGTCGTWEHLLEGRDVECDLEAFLHEVTVSVAGRVDDLRNPQRPSLRFAIAGPELVELRRMFGLDDSGAGSLDLEGELEPEDGGPLRLGLRGEVGESRVEVDGRISDLREFRDAEINIRASGPDLGELLRLARIDQARDAPFAIDLDAERHGPLLDISRAEAQFAGATLTGSVHMPHFPSLDDAAVHVELEGDDIVRFRRLTGMPGAATGPFSLRADVTATGAERVPVRLELKTGLAALAASGELGRAPTYAGSTFDIRVRVDDLAKVGNAWHVSGLPSLAADLEGAVAVEPGGVRITDPLVLSLGGATARVRGRASTAAWLAGSELAFEVDAPDLAALVGHFADAAHVPALPIVATGKLEPAPGVLAFSDVQAQLGSSTIGVDGRLALAPGITGSRFTVSAHGPAFEQLVRAVADVAVRPGDFRFAGTLLFDADVLRLDDIRLERELADASLDLTIGRAGAPHVEFDGQASGRDVRVLLQAVRGFTADEAPFSISARGRADGGSLALERLDVTVGEARAGASGTLLFDGSAGSRFVTNGTVPDLAALGRLGERRLNRQAFRWDATVTGGQGRLQVDDFRLALGPSELAGTFAYQAGDVPRIDMTVTSPSFVVAPLLEPAEAPAEAAEAPARERLVPDIAVPYDAMRSIDGSLRVQLGELGVGALALSEVELAANLEGGTLDLARLGFRARAGRLDASGRLEPAGESGHASLKLVARDLAFGLAEYNQDLSIRGDADVELAGTGADLREILAGARGVVLIDSRGGRYANQGLGLLFGDALQELLSTLNPFMKSEEYTILDCVVVPLEIQAGIASSVPNSLVRTNKIEIATQGKINLGSEKLDISVRTVPRKGVVISAAEIVNPYFRVGGTLAQPSLGVDEQGVLISGGAAVATGGLSIVAKAMWDRLSRAADPCNETSARAREQLGERWPMLLDTPPTPH